MQTVFGRFIRSAFVARARRRSSLGACAALFAIALSACGPSKPMTPAEKGRIVYVTTCVVCHNINPNLAGSKGPPIAGSSRELVADRILYLKYPPGYKPKRTTHNMRAQPQLANRIDDLVAFLDEAAKTEAAKNQPVKTEAAKNDAAKNETAKSDPAKNEAAKKK